jgi:hypothetical protein
MIVVAAPATASTLIDGVSRIATRLPDGSGGRANFDLGESAFHVEATDMESREHYARTFGIASTCRLRMERVGETLIALTRTVSEVTQADMAMILNGDVFLARRANAIWEVWASFPDYLRLAADDLERAFGSFRYGNGPPLGVV